MLQVDVGRLARGERESARLRPWRADEAAVERVGLLGGGALAAAILWEEERARPGGETPLAIAIGGCVRRGVPTAARASVASRAPLSGLYSEGQVGGELARRLASVADALVVGGRTDRSGSVLVIDATGGAALEVHGELAGATPAETCARLAERHSTPAVLAIGPCGERGLAVASLAAWGEPPHFVGRGGLGAVLGRTGLKAIVVAAPPVRPEAPRGGRAAELVEALRSSPRLRARSEGGTLELFGASAARGELRSRNYSEAAAPEWAERIEREARGARQARHGCAGCPTPCGWVFDTRARSALGQGARFGASYALGANLGLERFEDSLELLGACDRLGVDAKEVGAGLALLCRARGRFGDRAQLLRWLAELGAGSGEGAALARGALACARDLGLERELAFVKGQAVRPDAGLAALLGACVSARGAEAMRAFPFLASDGGDRERLERLFAPMSVPGGAEDPLSPAGKGRLVVWHENLAAALDATGFCSFSAAALLADRVLDLDLLAAWIAPEALAPARGRDLIEAGGAICLLQRRLCERWGAGEDADRPSWARERLDLPGMYDEYRDWRGLDEHGRLLPSAVSRFEQGLELCAEPAGARPAAAGERAPAPDPRAERTARALGRVVLRSSGELARALSSPRELELYLPASAGEVLAAAERAVPAATGLLLREGRALPAVYRRGARLGAAQRVEAGDELDLLLVISGG